MKKKVKVDAALLYSGLAFSGLLITLITVLLSHGEGKGLFFYDIFDTGMDFFHSIEYVATGAPYEDWNVIYPPLANLFFSFCFLFVPESQYSLWKQDFFESLAMRGTYMDLRVWQSTMMLFIIFIIVTAIVLFSLLRKLVGKEKYNLLTTIFLMSSLGVVYAYERGNIILLSAIFLYIFIIYKDDTNVIIQELALIALAISAGLKLYPCFFGLLLLYEKKWKKAIRACIYGCISFVFPFFCFEERLNGIKLFISSLFAWTEEMGFSCNGLSMDKLINTGYRALEKLIGISGQRDKLLELGTMFNIVATLLILILGFRLKKEWEKLMVCGLAVLLFQTQSIYVLLFLLPALAVFIRDEKVVTNKNWLPFIAMTGCVIWFPLSMDTQIKFILTPQYFRVQCFEALLFAYVLVQFFADMKRVIQGSSVGGKRISNEIKD